MVSADLAVQEGGGVDSGSATVFCLGGHGAKLEVKCH